MSAFWIHLAAVLMGVGGGSVIALGGDVVDATSLRGKVLAGYQGWFRAPGDAQNVGWIHWSRDDKKITAETLSVEMWPDMAEYSVEEKFAAPGWTHRDGLQAYLFSSDHPKTVKRHFKWMRDYGIDGVWLQHFVVDLPGAPAESRYESRYESRLRVLQHVRDAAKATGRVWALTFDMTGIKAAKVVDLIIPEWKKLVDAGILKDGRYVHENGKPVVMLFGLYRQSTVNDMTTEVANQLIDFFQQPGPYQAFLGGAGEWHWRRNDDPAWQKVFRRLDAISPWNPGNYEVRADGEKRATTNYWAADKAECDAHDILWIPTVYPGFGWDNLKKQAQGKSGIPRRGGNFLWEQFHELSKLGADSAMVAMFDEVDEATAIFKVTNDPPVQASLGTYEGLPSDWYLRLVGEATRRLREKVQVPPQVPIEP
ncbi:hypothetical protein FEM03_06650 [Phragmitibacter flavus]|uniref:Xylosidase/arabinosidase n=1 Tax=Phragmitibacter flavus TaxID=2576071 RepID=A0A5R8KJL8_9BACT|nr:glycoside hydrolase family 71/99-like protein [Phragmitibacter flavus]TLD71809.1 hypothetical protein FEM03_06650 [Phragmitibacter flavus]